jgi:gliding motility-associated-like protein
MKFQRSISLLVTFLLTAFTAYGQQPAVSRSGMQPLRPQLRPGMTPARSFSVSLNNSSFIENKGQYNSLSGKGDGSQVVYGGQAGNVQVLFSASGVEFVRYIAEKEEHEGEKDEREERKFETERFSLEFLNANPLAAFTAGDKSPEYFTFMDPADNQRTIIANGFKKIICHDVWPGIDVQYEFPQKGGLKYSFIVHPGADPSRIREKWNGVSGLSKTAKGDIEFISHGEKFTDAAPVAFYEDNSGQVNCSFELKSKNVSFALGNYDATKTLVIDPWTASPGFTSFNSGYDIVMDGSGNIYVYGGQNPYQLKKFTSAGVPIWTYNTAASGYYGDLCVDFIGNPYVVYGPWGDVCVKLTPAGALTWSVTGGSPNAREIYRVFMNPLSSQLSIMGMEMPGTGGQCPMYLQVDPNTGTYAASILHPTNTTGEVRGMCVDVNGDVYGLSYAAVSSSSIPNDNIIWKVDAAGATLGTIIDGYTLGEVDASYTDSEFSGFNGLAVGCALYSFDGLTLKKWDKVTMTLQGSVSVPGGLPYNIGGVYTDPCGNVYVGSPTGVYMYDASLTLVTTQVTTGAVYDVAPGMVPGEILATGAGFFASLTFPTTTCSATLSTSSTPSTSCPCNGTASITAASTLCTSGTFTYQWLPTGGTNDTAFNLCPGTYTVVYTDVQTGVQDSATVTVTGSSPSVSVTSTQVDPTCYGYANGSATANPSGGTAPYTYLWTPGNQTNQTAINLGAGTYVVTVTDSAGCTGTQNITLTQPPGMTFTLASSAPSCSGCNGTATVNASGGSPSYTYNWNSAPVQTTSTATSLCAGTYIVTVTDSTGCFQDTSLTLVANNPVTLTASADSALLCFGDCDGSITAVAGNGTAPYSYSWNTVPVQLTATATNLCQGNYQVTVTDSNNCSQTFAISLTEPTKLTIPVMPPINACAGICGNLGTAPTGGTPGYSFLWNPGNLVGNNVQVCPAVTTTYTLVVTDNNGCSETDSVVFTVLPSPAVAFTADTFQGCEPLCVTFTNNTPGSGSVMWYYGDLAFDNTGQHCYTNGTYDVTLIVVGTNGCTDTLTQTSYITVFPIPTAGFTLPPILPLSEWEPDACFGNTSTGATGWLWNFGDPNDTTSSNLAAPCHTYSDTGVYCVQLVVFNGNGCTDTTVQCLEIIPEGSTIYIPNTFTPNGDTKNEIFIPVGDGISSEKYHFMVFDRWGMLIYETTTWGEGWDGTFHGNKCQQDTYVWKVTCWDESGHYHNLIGHVNLIR